jgi:hypothetical protein
VFDRVSETLEGIDKLVGGLVVGDSLAEILELFLKLCRVLFPLLVLLQERLAIVKERAGLVVCTLRHNVARVVEDTVNVFFKLGKVCRKLVIAVDVLCGLYV